MKKQKLIQSKLGLNWDNKIKDLVKNEILEQVTVLKLDRNVTNERKIKMTSNKTDKTPKIIKTKTNKRISNSIKTILNCTLDTL